MTETLRPIQEPTRLFREMIKRATAVAYLLDARIAEKPFRGYMVGMGTKFGRICMMPGLTRDMMEWLVVIENPQGTRIAFSVKGRAWHNDNGDISRKGKHGNLPAGECYTAPVE